jgi:hypothetical protein
MITVVRGRPPCAPREEVRGSLSVLRALLAVVEPALLVACCAACASEATTATGTAHRDAGGTEQRAVKLTLFPFWDVSEDANGFLPAAPLDGVKVCVDRVRRIHPGGGMGKWADFVRTNGPCTTSVAGQNVVLDGVPPSSELVVTAEKDGYRPSVYAVTTGESAELNTMQYAQDADLHEMRLERADSPWTRSPTGDKSLGDLSLYVNVCRGYDCRPFVPASIELLPEGAEGGVPQGSGPFIWNHGKSTPGGNASLTTFVNLPDGEYSVVLRDPRVGCINGGLYWGEVYTGFAAPLNEFRAPVLAGYSTPWIAAACSCKTDLSAPGALGFSDASPTCPSGTDAGAP